MTGKITSLHTIAAAAAKSLHSCPTLRPHRRQPTRLPGPWDSPGKTTGVGCHFLLQGMKVKSDSEVAQSCPTLSDPMDCSPPGSSVHRIFQARVLEWVCHCLLRRTIEFLLKLSGSHLFIYSSVAGHLGFVYVLAVETELQRTLGCTCLCELQFSQGVCPRVGLLGHMVVLVLVF